MNNTLLSNFMNNNVDNIELLSNNEDDTKNIAIYISKFLKQKDIVVLNGQLR